jgi:hypothetical protein
LKLNVFLSLDISKYITPQYANSKPKLTLDANKRALNIPLFKKSGVKIV